MLKSAQSTDGHDHSPFSMGRETFRVSPAIVRITHDYRVCYRICIKYVCVKVKLILSKGLPFLQRNVSEGLTEKPDRWKNDWAINLLNFDGGPTCWSGTSRLQWQRQTIIRRRAGLIVGHVGH